MPQVQVVMEGKNDFREAWDNIVAVQLLNHLTLL